MSKILKLISISLLGLFLTSGAFAKTEVVYIPKIQVTLILILLLKDLKLVLKNMVITFQQ